MVRNPIESSWIWGWALKSTKSLNRGSFPNPMQRTFSLTLLKFEKFLRKDPYGPEWANSHQHTTKNCEYCVSKWVINTYIYSTTMQPKISSYMKHHSLYSLLCMSPWGQYQSTSTFLVFPKPFFKMEIFWCPKKLVAQHSS